MRHFAWAFCGTVFWCPICSHAGIASFRFFVILIGAKVAAYVFAAFSIRIVSSPNFSARLPLVGADHVCRKGFPFASSGRFFGAVSFISTSVMYAHVGLFVFLLRYSFRHISSIASFLCLRFSSSMPPLSVRSCSAGSASLGFGVLSHIKFLIMFVSVSVMLSGIP